MLVSRMKKPLSIKGAVKIIRKYWVKGSYSDFDKLLHRLTRCSLEKARSFREYLEEMDVLAYDSQGILVWYHGDF